MEPKNFSQIAQNTQNSKNFGAPKTNSFRGFGSRKSPNFLGKEKVNVAVIGCGIWGANLIRNFSQIPEVELVTMCDLDQSKLEEIKINNPNLKFLTDFNEVLIDKLIDAIVIATPVATHFSLVKQALEAGKHVFIEKPETETSKQAEELLRLSKEKNLILMVDHTFLYSPAINKIKEILHNKELGETYYLHAEWLSLGRLQPEVNVIWDLAVHVFSALIYILGKKPISLSVKAESFFRKNIDEVAVITLNFPDKIQAFVTVSWIEPEKTRKITIIGNKKMLLYDMMAFDKLKVYNKTVNINGREITYTDNGVQAIEIDEKEPLKLSCSHFIDCIKNNKKPISDGEDGLNVVRILEATTESIKNNGKEIFLN